MFAADLYAIAPRPIFENPWVTIAISHPEDIFSLYLKVTLVAAVFISSTFILGQAWLFISPGL